MNGRLTLGWLCGILVGKCEIELEEAAFPDGLLSSWNANIPILEVNDAVELSVGFGIETEGMVFAPLLSLFAESI
jgi:hypothetical protein